LEHGDEILARDACVQGFLEDLLVLREQPSIPVVEMDSGKLMCQRVCTNVINPLHLVAVPQVPLVGDHVVSDVGATKSETQHPVGFRPPTFHVIDPGPWIAAFAPSNARGSELGPLIVVVEKRSTDAIGLSHRARCRHGE
jgi:hypothetical protein